jgi:RHS repeat-associated protein
MTTAYTNGQPGTPSTLYFGYDGHGSVRILLNGAGAIATVAGIRQLFNYDAYGNAIGFQLAQAATTLLYSGQQTDAATGLQYLRARYYNPNADSFTSLDPYGGDAMSPLSYNTYLYTQGDPVNGYDPSGQDDFSLDVSSPAADSLAADFQGKNDKGQTHGGKWESVEQDFTRQDYNWYLAYRKMRFTPNANSNVDVKDIGFIQLIKRTKYSAVGKKGRSNRLPRGQNNLNGSHFKGRMAGLWAVDRHPGAKDGWWSNRSDDDGSAYFWDPPNSNNTSVKWEFQTFAIARTDENGKSDPKGDSGVVLSGIRWGFTVDKNGQLVAWAPLRPVTQFWTFEAAISAWNDQTERGARGKADGQLPFGNLRVSLINLPYLQYWLP